MKTIGLFYGSTNGATAVVAERIAAGSGPSGISGSP
jgi:flavodoxin